MINGKMYIGQTVNLKNRWRQHCYSSDCPKLKRAIMKYGKDSFKVETLITCVNKKSANHMEIALIGMFQTRILGYNISVGGDGFGIGSDNPMYGKKHSDVQKLKWSLDRKGIKNNNYGKKMSAERRRQLSETKIKAALFGEKNNNCKYTNIQRLEMCEMYANGETVAEIARYFNAPYPSVHKIVKYNDK